MRRILAVLALTLFAACSNGLKEAELHGVYLATYENGTERITLEKGGTFIQEVRLDGSASPVVNTGTWQYTSDGVALEHCWGVHDLFGKRIRPDFASKHFVCGPMPVMRRWLVVGELRLRGDEDPTPLWKVQ